MNIQIIFRFLAVALLAAIAVPLGAHAQSQSGLLTKPTKLPPLTLASGKPLAEKPYDLEAGKYYRLTIKADGTAELGIVGPNSSGTSGSTKSSSTRWKCARWGWIP